jgi:hypothetical protein
MGYAAVGLALRLASRAAAPAARQRVAQRADGVWRETGDNPAA